MLNRIVEVTNNLLKLEINEEGTVTGKYNGSAVLSANLLYSLHRQVFACQLNNIRLGSKVENLYLPSENISKNNQGKDRFMSIYFEKN